MVQQIRNQHWAWETTWDKRAAKLVLGPQCEELTHASVSQSMLVALVELGALVVVLVALVVMLVALVARVAYSLPASTRAPGEAAIASTEAREPRA